MKKIWTVYNEIEEKFCIITFFVIVITVFAQVICRYFIGASLTWSEEMCRYLYVWECWLGVSLTQRYDRHIKLLFIVERLSMRKQMIINAIALILSVGCAVILAYYGFHLVFFTKGLASISPALKLPMWIYYLCLPIGCVAYIVRVLVQTAYKIMGKELIA